MKYIVIEVDRGGMPVRYPIVFPDQLVHADVASTFLWGQDEFQNAKVVSAGFVNSVDFAGQCYGESTSIGVGSDPDDTLLLRMRDYNAGMVL